MRPIVGIVDYQSGNIRSVANAVEHAGAQVTDVRTAGEMAHCTHLILPGVGAFGFCAERLDASGLRPALEEWTLAHEKPLLGICVGMQLLADYSEEHGRHAGLGWINGTVRKLDNHGDPVVRIPHVGWNEVTFSSSFGDFGVGESANFYFDHSYAFDTSDTDCEAAVCHHGRTFSAMIRRNNIVAAQFHPEKSQTSGMRLLRGFFGI